MGFLGAHSDIGGGYNEGDLSAVALMWTIKQTELAGLTFDKKKINKGDFKIVTDPVVHSSLDVFPFYNADRDFRYIDGTPKIKQARPVARTPLVMCS